MDIYPQSAMLPWMIASGFASAQLGQLRDLNEGRFMRSPYLAFSFLSVVLWMVCATVFVGVYAWKVSWWAVLGLPMTAALGTMLGAVIERLIGNAVVALLSLVVWPVAMYLAFSNIPKIAGAAA